MIEFFTSLFWNIVYVLTFLGAISVAIYGLILMFDGKKLRSILMGALVLGFDLALCITIVQYLVAHYKV